MKSRQWVNSSRSFAGISSGSCVPRRMYYFRTARSLKIKALCSLKTLPTDQPVTSSHDPEEPSSQPHSYEYFKISDNIPVTLLISVKVILVKMTTFVHQRIIRTYVRIKEKFRICVIVLHFGILFRLYDTKMIKCMK
jgi:hypothetical protein